MNEWIYKPPSPTSHFHCDATKWYLPYFDIIRNIDHVNRFFRILGVTWFELIRWRCQLQLNELFICCYFWLQVTCWGLLCSWKSSVFHNDWITDNARILKAEYIDAERDLTLHPSESDDHGISCCGEGCDSTKCLCCPFQKLRIAVCERGSVLLWTSSIWQVNIYWGPICYL